MKEIYRLDGANLPTLPTPHDAVIKHIKKEGDFLIFTFEDDISYHDSVKYQRPSAKSLVIKYHLIDDYSCSIFYQRWNKLWKRSEYIELKNEKVLFEADSEYLFHYVMYQELIINLFQKKSYYLHLYADYLEYEWIE